MKIRYLVGLFGILLFSFSLINPDSVNAQHGSYGCFASGASGGCRTSLANTCTNGGVVPNPSGCNGLDPASCHDASFSCDAPPVGTTCATALDCPTFYNCIDSLCVPSGGAPGSIVSSGPPIIECGIETAIGCVPVESEQALAEFFLGWGLGIGGGIALIMIAISSFMIMTSAGDPGKIQAGKELLTSAVSGLILLAFSAYILGLIGVKILGIFEL